MHGVLRSLLDVRQIDASTTDAADQVFVGESAGQDGMALYGGHLLGQAVTAACKTVEPESHMHSLNSYFLRGGDGLLPVDYEVSVLRQGRSYGTRRVAAMQSFAENSKQSPQRKSQLALHQIFDMTASFHKPEQPGYESMSVPAPTGLADPASLPTFQDCINELGPIFGEHWSYYPRPVEYRVARAPWLEVGASEQQGIDFWFRVEASLPDDHKMHAALLAYMSDDCLSDNVGVPYQITAGVEDIMLLSLGHSMWFHRPVRVDEWVFVQQWPLTVSGARGTAQGYFWQDGQLVATAVQEATARFKPPQT